MIRLPFHDRRHAGRMLARTLSQYTNHPDAVVLGLPRGGVPVAFEVAENLHLPMDIFLVRKLGVPGHEELAMGAIASGGTRVLNQSVIQSAHISESAIERVALRELVELERRERVYRRDRPPIDVRGREVILVDDGLATGSTMRAAAEALKRHGSARIVVGVPVASPESCDEFRDVVDEIICAATPEAFFAVGAWYEEFASTSDDEVRQLLEEHARRRVAAVEDPIEHDQQPG